jgi:hypothetical protein
MLSIYGGSDAQPPSTKLNNCFLGIGKTQVNTAPVEIGDLYVLPSGAELDACRDGQAVVDRSGSGGMMV